MVVGSAWLVSCTPDRSIDRPDGCQVMLDPELYEHACQHGVNGPFSPALAAARLDDAVAPVNAAQRALEVTLPGLVDDDLTSYLRYRPTRDGRHAAFAGVSGQGVPIEFLRGHTRVESTAVVPVDDALACGGMRDVTGVDLIEGEDYVIAIGPTRSDHIVLFIEHVDTFGGEDWDLQCPG